MLAERYIDQIFASLLTTPGLTVANFPAQQVPITLDTTDPIEEIRLVTTATYKANVTTYLADGHFNLLKRVRLSLNHPILGPITPVDISGPGLIGLQAVEHGNIDPASHMVQTFTNSNNTPNGAILRSTYRLMFPHPLFTDALNLATLLPVHLFSSAPTLYLDFGAATDICSGTADPFSSVVCEVIPIRRRWKGDFAAYVASKVSDPIQYFVPCTIGESQLSVPANLTSVEQRMTVPSPGRLATLLLRYFKGTATMSRATIDDSTTIGAETVWELQQGRSPIRKWRNKQLQIDNAFAQPRGQSWNMNWYSGMITAPGTGGNTADGVTTGAPPVWVTAKQLYTADGFGGALAAGQGIQDPAEVALNFGGMPGREIYETGGFLDVSSPIRNNQITEVVGKVTTPANQPSIIKMVTRLYPDALDRFATG